MTLLSLNTPWLIFGVSNESLTAGAVPD